MKTFTVYSDRGGAVRFGMHGNNQTLIESLYYPTTFGDGEIKVVVCSSKEYFEEFKMKNNEGRFFGVVGGKFNLYEDDCSQTQNAILASFEGEYQLFDQMDAYNPMLVMVVPFNKTDSKITYEKEE